MERSLAGRINVVSYTSWPKSVYSLLDASAIVDRLSSSETIIIKPNLVEALDPPITTPVELIASIVDYFKDKTPQIKLIVAEGSGARDYDTSYTFRELGYVDMAEKKKVKLLDLNEEPSVRMEIAECHRWPEMYLPQIVFDSFLISVPVLKAHSLAGVTLTMKNMMGLAPPKYYQQGGQWKKASFHANVQEAVFDLNRYRSPDFTILDATVGMQQAHLWGPTCNPPHNKLAASFDPVAIDAYGASLLRKNWKEIGHIHMAHNELGIAEPLTIKEHC